MEYILLVVIAVWVASLCFSDKYINWIMKNFGGKR